MMITIVSDCSYIIVSVFHLWLILVSLSCSSCHILKTENQD